MSTRSYSNLIVLESLYDSIPTTNSDVTNLATSVFQPIVPVVASDCGTTLGKISEVTYETEGLVELATGVPFSHGRILQLLSQGIYSTSVRTLNTCIAPGGICQACYNASHQYEAVPAIGSSVQIQPEYVTYTESIPVHQGDVSVTISQQLSLYDRVYVYYQGVLLSPSSYTVSDTVLSLKTPISNDGYVTLRYTTFIRAPFLFWLASTYSGSMLGIKELPSPGLTLRKRLLTSLVPQSMLESVAGGVKNLNGLPEEVLSYLPSIQDPLEKALFVLALYAVYLNVSQ